MNLSKETLSIVGILSQYRVLDMVQALLEFYFFARFSGKKPTPVSYFTYIILTFFLSTLEIAGGSASPSSLFILLRIGVLGSAGVLLLKCSLSMSILSATVTRMVAFLAAGTSASVTLMLFSFVAEKKSGLFFLGIAGQIFIFTLLIGIYFLILKKFTWKDSIQTRYLSVFFLPAFLIMMVEQYIFDQIYGNEIITEGTKLIKPAANHGQIFLIQLCAYFGLFSVLYACRKLTEDFSERMRFALYRQEMETQKTYVEEASCRYEKTRAFRHDVKNHLLVLKGLLEQGKTEEAGRYLNKLENISETLSLPCKTGNAVVDILLGSKLDLARKNGIETECTVRLPEGGAWDDLDLCVLFSNAVDNAIHACGCQEIEKRFIYISASQKGDFFMIEVENSCSLDISFMKGTGLANILAVAERYKGAMTTEKRDGVFKLHVMLVISRHLDDISVGVH